MRLLILYILIFFFCSCMPENQYEKGHYYTLEEALKKPLDVTTLDLGDHLFRRKTEEFFTLDGRVKELINLERFEVACNHINQLPTEITQLKRLKWVTIVDADNMRAPTDNCDLDLGDTFEKLAQIDSLETLYIPYVRSELPPEIGLLKNISTLSMVFNGLEELPPQIGKLENLKTLSIRYNHLTSLPQELLELDSLRTLHLNTNIFSEIPSVVFDLTKVTSIDLSSNEISSINDEIVNLEQLVRLDLSYNEIDRIPEALLSLGKLESLNLSSNNIEVLPDDISKLQNLGGLDLESNKLIQIPARLGEMDSLRGLNVASNNIQHLPETFSKLQGLRHINLSENKLNYFPSSLTEIETLETLNLGYNDIQEIPVDIGQLKRLNELHLEGNKISTIPKSLFDLTDLEVLLIGDYLSEDIPIEILNLKKLRFTILHGYSNLGTALEADIKEHYPWIRFLSSLLYILPVLLGFFFVLLALYAKRKWSAVNTITICFLLSIVLILIGAFCSWKIPLLTYDLFSVEFIYPEAFVKHWETLWYPFIASLASTLILFLISIKARIDFKTTRI